MISSSFPTHHRNRHDTDTDTDTVNDHDESNPLNATLDTRPMQVEESSSSSSTTTTTTAAAAAMMERDPPASHTGASRKKRKLSSLLLLQQQQPTTSTTNTNTAPFCYRHRPDLRRQVDAVSAEAAIQDEIQVSMPRFFLCSRAHILTLFLYPSVRLSVCLSPRLPPPLPPPSLSCAQTPTHTLPANAISTIRQKIDTYPASIQDSIHAIWDGFSSACADVRTTILAGLLMKSCMPQLSYVAEHLPPLLRMDILASLPVELSFKILSYLDASSLCRAAQVVSSSRSQSSHSSLYQVSRVWKRVANDDVLWHRMCGQHIDKVTRRSVDLGGLISIGLHEMRMGTAVDASIHSTACCQTVWR